jgi:hypothetical protein
VDGDDDAMFLISIGNDMKFDSDDHDAKLSTFTNRTAGFCEY